MIERQRMGSKHNQKRMNVNGDVDILSSLSDDLIHKIFSRISTKLVVQTSALSSRWRFIWTSIPHLNLSAEDFPTLSWFDEFVTHVLSRRNTEIEVSSVKLSFGQKVNHGFVKKIMDYVFSRNFHQLNLSCLILDRGSEFPLSLISFPSLKYLSLSNGMSTFKLPAALTTLQLKNVDLSNDDINSLLSKCANLKNLTLEIVNSEYFSISHPRLSNLTLDNNFSGNIVTPKLEHIAIRKGGRKEYVFNIYAPDLNSFVYKGDYCSLSLCTDGFNSLKEADIYVSMARYQDPHHILSLLQHLHNVKFLTLNMEILEHLSSRVELILRQPVGFTNLKRLKICPQSVSWQGQAAPDNSYYLDSSPGAKLEEIIAQSIMVKLWVLLEQENTNTKTDMTRMERRKDPTKSHGGKMLEHRKSQADTKLQIVKSVREKIHGRWHQLCLEIDRRKSKYRLILSQLQKIEEFLEKLPASRRALIQPCLASVYAEAATVMGGITDLMKTRFDQNESRMSVCVQELATTLKPSY